MNLEFLANVFGVLILILGLCGSIFLVMCGSGVKADSKVVVKNMIDKVSCESDPMEFQWLRGAGYAIAPFALPVGGAAVVAGNLAHSIKNGFNIRKTKMPQDWYEVVLKESSADGKVYLGNLLKEQGYVSVYQASKWLESENKLKNPAMSKEMSLLIEEADKNAESKIMKFKKMFFNRKQ
jgi:hypothetical protein